MRAHVRLGWGRSHGGDDGSPCAGAGTDLPENGAAAFDASSADDDTENTSPEATRTHGIGGGIARGRPVLE